MNSFDTMTAMAPTRSRPTALVRNDVRWWNGFASMGIDQHCGRSFALGGAV